MIPEFNIHELKIVSAGFAALVAAVTDGVVAPEGSLESISMKVMLILAIVYLARELSKQRESEAKAGAERERKIEEVVAKNTEAMSDMTQEVAKQTSYFQTVAQTLLGKIKEKP